MNDIQKRKKSPRAPSIALDDAIEKVMKVYDKERLHEAATEVVAQDLGYKGANNGAGLGVSASLRYYGLLERAREGRLSVAKEVESYRYAPSDEMRNSLLIQWLKGPVIFSELLEKYENSLPSDAALKYDLIHRGFIPAGVDSVIQIFKRSIEFAKFFDRSIVVLEKEIESNQSNSSDTTDENHGGDRVPSQNDSLNLNNDRIPVRLSGSRRAWLEIPTPFYSADKIRLKAQIDLLITDDEGLNKQ